MIIAKAKKESNIAEYLLYMWQLEDLFRANDLDEKKLYQLLIAPLKLDDQIKKEIWNWYQDLIQEMIDQEIEKTGHLASLNEIVFELNFLHQTLITVSRDPKYLDFYLKAKANLELLKSKSGSNKQSDIETALNGLYGLLMLRLKKEEVSKETEEAMAAISKMVAYLTAVYHKIKNGELTLPGNS
jgi:hypothetical protein